MANTTNFNWETPDDTDLVKDGAAAIRTLGSAIDTSLVDLKGGTTGQILSKATNTDMDFTWITNDVGDITAVSAGTGITGGGTTGAITITNDMATTITAAGDIVVGTGSGTYDNLPIGTTGQVLTADTTVSPYKVKWASTAGTFTGCLAVTTAASQSISNATFTAKSFPGTDVYDTDGFHDPATNNSRITIPTGLGGYYLVYGQVNWDANATGRRLLYIRKNGTAIYFVEGFASSASIYPTNTVSIIDNFAAGDYLELFVYQNSGGSLNVLGDPAATFFGVKKQ
tara:strand:+ start:227 stop:1078 length:852 start_codon:yes stop_codon:yes gene_type:complete